MYISNPSLYSHEVQAYRKTAGVDAEGTPLQTYTLVAEFRGGFGTASADRELVKGYAGQRVDAAISTSAIQDIQVGDKIVVSEREWAVVGVIDTAITQRILLARWAEKQ